MGRFFIECLFEFSWGQVCFTLGSMDISTDYWRKCSTCKKEIPYRHAYYQCNVSTCNRKRTGLVFCSVSCFEQHLPGARHRDAYAIEETSPTFEQWKREVTAEESRRLQTLPLPHRAVQPEELSLRKTQLHLSRLSGPQRPTEKF